MPSISERIKQLQLNNTKPPTDSVTSSPKLRQKENDKERMNPTSIKNIVQETVAPSPVIDVFTQPSTSEESVGQSISESVTSSKTLGAPTRPMSDTSLTDITTSAQPALQELKESESQPLSEKPETDLSPAVTPTIKKSDLTQSFSSLSKEIQSPATKALPLSTKGSFSKPSTSQASFNPDDDLQELRESYLSLTQMMASDRKGKGPAVSQTLSLNGKSKGKGLAVSQTLSLNSKEKGSQQKKLSASQSFKSTKEKNLASSQPLTAQATIMSASQTLSLNDKLSKISSLKFDETVCLEKEELTLPKRPEPVREGSSRKLKGSGLLNQSQPLSEISLLSNRNKSSMLFNTSQTLSEKSAWSTKKAKGSLFFTGSQPLNDKTPQGSTSLATSQHMLDSVENLASEVFYSTSRDFELSLSQMGHSVTSQAASQTWITPHSVEELVGLVEKEQAEGTTQSQLALCLHLLSVAAEVDPQNDIPITQEIKRRHSMLEDIKHTLHPKPAPETLGQAMVFEAKKLLKLLAQGGHSSGGEAEAQFLLGNCYGMGALGWPAHPRSAFQWYFQASKNGHAEATYRTAVCYEMGIGTEVDGGCAVMFYKKAAHLLHVPSMYKLGVILMRGYCDQPVSKREGVMWLQRAACHDKMLSSTGDLLKQPDEVESAGLPQAFHALAMVHLTQECEQTSVIPDPNYAIKLLHNAARLGYAPSQSKLGELYESGNYCPEDEAQSIYWYSLAAKQDYPEACLALSGWYLTGSLVGDTLEQSDNNAFLWAVKAAKLAKLNRIQTLSGKAYYTLGVYHENGIGVEKSVDNAKKWFKKAERYGYSEPSKPETQAASTE